MSDSHYPGAEGKEHRINLTTPRDLTPEEAELLKKLRFESSWTRGYPLALLTGGLTVLGTRHMKSPRLRIALPLLGMVAGNVVGKISYLPVIQDRILNDLPETSPLRQKVQAFKDGGPEAVAKLGLSQLRNYPPNDSTNDDNHHNVTFDSGSEFETKNMESASESTPARKYTSYEELRKRHREGKDLVKPGEAKQEALGFLNLPSAEAQSGKFSNNDNYSQPSQIDSNVPSKPVRYNKYGDPIVE